MHFLYTVSIDIYILYTYTIICHGFPKVPLLIFPGSASCRRCTDVANPPVRIRPGRPAARDVPKKWGYHGDFSGQNGDFMVISW